MGDPVFDEHVQFYVEFVDSVLAAEPSLFREMCTIFSGMLGPRLEGATVCDVGCGEGYLTRHLARQGPRSVVGIDLSNSLIEIARERTDSANAVFRVDDAQTLSSFADGSVDVVVSQMAVMDVADHRAMFDATRRVLNARGLFAFSLLHPCFEGPYRPPNEPQFLLDDKGTRIGCVVRRYATEGYWRAEGAGVRGQVGSYHRMLSTYINDLVASGFRIDRLVEPVFDVPGVGAQVPRVMMVLTHAE